MRAGEEDEWFVGEPVQGDALQCRERVAGWERRGGALAEQDRGVQVARVDGERYESNVDVSVLDRLELILGGRSRSCNSRSGRATRKLRTISGTSAPVFASAVGTELHPSNVARRVLKPAAAAAAGLPWASFHTYRHTCASLLFDAGRNVKQVQEWLGHSVPGFTLRTYVHLMDEGLGDADFLDDAVRLAADPKEVEHAGAAAS